VVLGVAQRQSRDVSAINFPQVGTKASSRDVFLSYEHSDRIHAKQLAEALEQEGWTVWWDLHIAPGKAWAEEIEKFLRGSRCVVVLWSSASVKSKWVNKEARLAERSNILVPALIEAVETPWEFEHLQAAELIDWDGARTEGYQQLVAELQDRLGTSAATNAPDQPRISDRLAHGKPARERSQPTTSVGKPTTSPGPGQPSAPYRLPVWNRPVAGGPPKYKSPARRNVLAQTASIQGRSALSVSRPTFRGSTAGRLLRYVSVIAAIGLTTALATNWVSKFVASLQPLFVSELVRSGIQRWPTMPFIAAGLVVVAVILTSWFFADDETPVDSEDYAAVSTKSSVLAAVLSLTMMWLFSGISLPWLALFPYVGIGAASAALVVYAINDEAL
jgi:hypothetical protein